jgi:hypothetical protein
MNRGTKGLANLLAGSRLAQGLPFNKTGTETVQVLDCLGGAAISNPIHRRLLAWLLAIDVLIFAPLGGTACERTAAMVWLWLEMRSLFQGKLSRDFLICLAPVAQLDRAPGYEPGGREFESLRARQLPKVLPGPSVCCEVPDLR